MARHYRARSRRSALSYGYERARQHISEAHALSEALGGTDNDVKAYFFKLTPARLKVVLDKYESQYGRAARQYAERTIPNWASRTTQMSGMVAERLFNLLPPLMPATDKFKLIETLWQHYGPSSKKVLRISPDVEVEAVLAAFAEHIDAVATAFRVPPQLENRFSWLAAGDALEKQRLLNHMIQKEKELVAAGIRQQAPLMLAHMKSEAGALTQRMAQIVKVGKHELEILVDPKADGVSLEDPSTYRASTGFSGNLGCLIIAAVLMALLYFLSHH